MNYPARLPFNCCCCYLAEFLAGALSITQIPLFFVHNSPGTVWLCLDNQLFMQICEPPSNTSVAMWLFDQHTMWRESVTRCLHTLEQPIPISVFLYQISKDFLFCNSGGRGLAWCAVAQLLRQRKRWSHAITQESTSAAALTSIFGQSTQTLPVLPPSVALFPLLLFEAFLSKMISMLFSLTSPASSSSSK